MTPENSQYFTFQEDTTTHKLTVQCNSGDYIHDALTLEIIATAKDDTTKTQTITLPVSNTSPTVGDITFTTDAGKDAAHSLQKTNNDNRLTAHVQSEVLIDNGNKTNYS
ncbi:hypothetical protein FACS1894166_11250 [Bacilli bacterium]|nr:hypothetical protein FACS1894166_11250 [Bacilli bacterium]